MTNSVPPYRLLSPLPPPAPALPDPPVTPGCGKPFVLVLLFVCPGDKLLGPELLVVVVDPLVVKDLKRDAFHSLTLLEVL